MLGVKSVDNILVFFTNMITCYKSTISSQH